MGVGHGHGGPPPEVETGRLARVILLGVLALIGVAAVIGTAVLWPDAQDLPKDADFTSDGTTVHTARVLTVAEPCPVGAIGGPGADEGASAEAPAKNCGSLRAELVTGPEKGSTVRVDSVPPTDARAGLTAGDSVRVFRITPQDPQAEAEGLTEPFYSWYQVERESPLGWMTALFVLVVAVVARLRGVLALIGLVFAAGVVVKFMLPALLTGGVSLAAAISIAVCGSTVIMFVVLYLAHGPSVRTSTALAGTLAGIAIAGGLGIATTYVARIGGVGSEDVQILTAHASDLNYQGLFACAVIIAGLGILNDVTITQSSSVWEIRAAAPQMSRWQIYRSGMRIGRDHIASTIYTIVFAYAGASLATLMLLSIYNQPIVEFISSEAVSEEIVRTLSSGVGLVLAVPITTAIAALTVAGPRSSGEHRA